MTVKERFQRERGECNKGQKWMGEKKIQKGETEERKKLRLRERRKAKNRKEGSKMDDRQKNCQIQKM